MQNAKWLYTCLIGQDSNDFFVMFAIITSVYFNYLGAQCLTNPSSNQAPVEGQYTDNGNYILPQFVVNYQQVHELIQNGFSTVVSVLQSYR